MAKTYLLISEEFSGEVNTASSLGSAPAAEIVGPKVGTDLKFKRIKAGNNISLNDSDPNYVEITASVPTAAANAFDRFALPDGNDAVADGATDTITFQTPDNKVVITGAPDDFVNFTVDETNFNQAAFSHNSISDVDANQHVDHSAVFINSGGALTGGGAITSSQTISLDISNLPPDTPVSSDYLITYDVDEMNHKKVTIDSILPPPTPQANSFGRVNTPDANSLDADLPTDTLNLESGNNKLDITGDVGTDTVTFTVQEGNITHDNLNGVSPNQHVDHTQVNVLGGEGLTNSGDTTIASNVVVDLDILGLDPNASPNTLTSHIVVHDGVSHKKVIIDNILPEPTPQADSYKTVTVNGTPVVADVPSDNLTITSTNKLNVTGNDINNSISLDVNEANLSISHNNLTDVDANQHIDHSTINITAGNGLSGGGTIDNPTINLDLDINDVPTTIQPLDKAADFVAFHDTSDGTTKKVLIQDIGGQGNVIGPTGATDNAVARFDTTTGELLQDSSLSVTDTGEVLGVDGTTFNPTYSFSNDADTGIYAPTTDTLAVTAGGVDKLSINPSSINALTKINSTAGLYRYNTTYTTSSTISGNDDVVYADATAGNIVLTLPSIGNMCVSITKIDSTAFTVTLQATGVDTILGQSTYVLDKQWDSVYLSRKITGEWYPMTISSDLSDNQVVDHANVSISAGAGLSGGGDITTTRSLSLDITTLTEDTTPDIADQIVTYDTSTGTHKKVLYNKLPQYATASLPDPVVYEGHTVYDSDTNEFKYSDGSLWVTATGGGGGGSGDVTGDTASTDNAAVRFSGSTGKVIQASYTGDVTPVFADDGSLQFTSPTYGSAVTIGGGHTLTGANGVAIGNLTSINVNSTAIGFQSLATGITSFALGYQTQATGNGSVSIGGSAVASGTERTVAIGSESDATQTGAIAVGSQSQATASNGSIAIGRSANASTGTGPIAIGQSSLGAGTSCVAIGYIAQVNASYGVAIGRGATVAAGAFDSVVLGYNATSSHQDCIVFGNGANTTAIRQFVAGGPNLAIAEAIFGKGPTSTAPVALTIRTSDGEGTDINGQNVTIRPGAGTGAGTGGHLIFQTAAAGASGSTVNTPTTQLEITDDGNIIMANLPTSSAGLPTGALWNNAGVLNIA